MPLLNNRRSYGWLSIVLHWLMAILLIGLYFSGDYMVDLSYQDSLYHILPDWHKAIGIIAGGLLVLRMAWQYSNQRPDVIKTGPAILHPLAALGHLGLYVLACVMVISGYLISTAKEKGIDVFGWFEFPAFLAADKDRGEIAGDIHEIAGTIFILLVLVHILAALLHHFYWKDHTLTRMLGRSKNTPGEENS